MQLRLVLMIALCALPLSAWAQQKQTITIRDGKIVGGNMVAAAGNRIVIGEEQKLMFDASASLMQKDYRRADELYSKVIAVNGGNVNAYLQRGLARREAGDARGAETDARAAVTLVNTALQTNPRDANLYYQRSQGLRLLKRFDQAKEDLLAGMRLNGNANWNNDLRAIELEQRMAASQVAQ